MSILNNLKDLDPSYKTDLDYWDCLGRIKVCLIIKEIRYSISATGMPKLAALNLEGTGVNDTGVIEYLDTQPQCLQHLNLNRTEVTQAIISHLTGEYARS